ncbi:hypothetical protein O1L55_05510 [Streptomyces albulus]|nr:hypothetical protein [Streptomyces noursei]
MACDERRRPGRDRAGAAPDTRTAVLHTEKGTLAGPDYVVHVVAAGGTAAFPAPHTATRQEAAG